MVLLYMNMKTKKSKFKNFLLVGTAIFLLLTGILIIWISTLKLPDFKTFTEQKMRADLIACKLSVITSSLSNGIG